MPSRVSTLASATVVALLAHGSTAAEQVSRDSFDAMRGRCEQLATVMVGKWPDSTTRIASAHFFDTTQVLRVPMFGAPPAEVSVPAHCEVFGALHERVGALGQNYSIRARYKGTGSRELAENFVCGG